MNNHVTVSKLTASQRYYLKNLLQYIALYKNTYPESTHIDPPRNRGTVHHRIYNIKRIENYINDYIAKGYYHNAKKEYLNNLRDLYTHLKNKFDPR